VRLKQYIREGEFGSQYEKIGRKTPMTNDEAKAFIHKHCKKSLFSTPIWRGTGGGGESDAFFIQPYKFQRESRNTSNHYSLLIDNSPEWTKYPKRSKSVICTLDHNTASHYGTAYRMFPVDGSRIGVCPSQDFWGSFDDFKPMDFFNTELIRIVEMTSLTVALMIEKHPKISEEAKPIDRSLFKAFKNAESYNAIYNTLEYVDSQKPFVKDTALNAENSGLWYATNFLRLHDYWKKPNLDLIVDLEERLSPSYNAFDLDTAGDKIAQKGNVEVWTDGDCVMIRSNALHIGIMDWFKE
jgi:hypothetical protein